tara:strand:- start:198 stop:884 length:687 start_codon:yes stop_codon:yes gene_type:complete
MTTIILNEKEVDLPDSWLDVTFNDFLAFSRIIKAQKTEEELKELYKDDTEEVQTLQISLANINFNTKIACFWTGMTEQEISLCSLEEVEEIMKNMQFLNEQYHPIALDKFTFRDETYYLPNLNMEGENFGTYIEAEQVEINNQKIENGNLDILPKQMAILCKKEGEVKGLVDDDLIDKREALFKEIDMATVWDVAFFLFRHESTLMTVFLTSLRKEEMRKQGLLLKEQ